MTNAQPNTGFQLGNRTYDRVKFLVTIVLPAFAALYIALGQLWELPKIEEVVGTITAIATFLGVALGVSSKNYDPESETEPVGNFILRQTPNDGTAIVLDLEKDPASLPSNSLITFRLKEDIAPLNEDDEDETYDGSMLP